MYKPHHPIRVVTAASLFDGHDASINLMRRLLQDRGCEVIHLGHNRSVMDVVTAALQEGAQAICMSSYQGGHMEYFKYMKDLLREAGADHVKIFGGGGGVIIPPEKRELQEYGIDFIFHPDDGRKMGLDGMISLIVEKSDFSLSKAAGGTYEAPGLAGRDELPHRLLGLALDQIDAGENLHPNLLQNLSPALKNKNPLVLGVTGTGGAGKSSLVDELLQRFLNSFPEIKIGVLCVDPSKRKTGGGLLGDRIRMNSLSRPGLFMRSIASRGSGSEIAGSLPKMLNFLKDYGFDLLIAETSGIGQANVAITELSDLALYVMTSEFGAQSQLEKIDMIDFADLIAINKADHRGSLDALRDVRKQYRRSRVNFEGEDESLPVYLTQAAQFNDNGVNELFYGLVQQLAQRAGASRETSQGTPHGESLFSSGPAAPLPGVHKQSLVPPDRQNYLSEIVYTVRNYKKQTEEMARSAEKWGAFETLKEDLSLEASGGVEPARPVDGELSEGKGGLAEVLGSRLKMQVPERERLQLEDWDRLVHSYSGDEFEYSVRNKTVKQPLTVRSLSGTKIRRVVPPSLKDWGDRLRFLRLENFPGQFPYTAGVFPLKRQGEDPKRMFAGEGTPERTNRRFHFLSKEEPAKRLSTAFDSVTLYGFDPHERPDIFGKVGESGVSICTLEDMKKLFAGFDLCSPQTSVSMTINGPAPMILAFYFNAAIDQQVEVFKSENQRDPNPEEYDQLKAKTLQSVRGTVQADILKEDQGQNTCIFSIDFALKMMGDIQQYFIDQQIRNFYSVSISGYHIAEAGANPISQVAFTLSNAFTFVEYYLARGMKIDDFARNLSFFFSNGMDPEYAVIGRVARRIWAIAMRDLYGASERSQKLKYHIQTSGRSLHAQEIDFNDIRTTLQALLAISDNCNSLHTNAYDEAITTPTEESVRRAMAIQMIINKEFGAARNENAMQGSFFFSELTDLVEEAILDEFSRISERGGVLGAMETQYQRGKIQEESMHYEHLKHSGELPIVGVNTYVNPETLKEGYEAQSIELARASLDEKNQQLTSLKSYQKSKEDKAKEQILALQQACLKGGNIFEALMEASRYCSLGQMTQALFEVGGQYRRNL